MKFLTLVFLCVASVSAFAQSSHLNRKEKIFYVNFKSRAIAKQIQEKFTDPEEPSLKDVATLIENSFSRDDLVINHKDAVACVKAEMNKKDMPEQTSFQVLLNGLATDCIVDHLYSLDAYSNWK